MKLVHISDVHLQVPYHSIPARRFWGRRLAGLFNLKVLGRQSRFALAAATLREILGQAADLGANHVTFTGDATALAFEQEFAAVREIFGDLLRSRGALSAIPGNHDMYTLGAVRHRRFAAAFAEALGSDLPVAVPGSLFPWVRLFDDGVALIGVDSTIPSRLPFVARGAIGEAQLRSLTAALRHSALRGRTIVLCLHHGPYRHDGTIDAPHHGLIDHAELITVAADHGVSLILHGHQHHPFIRAVPGRAVTISNCGSSTMSGVAGFAVYDLDDRGVHGIRRVTLQQAPTADDESA
ncbi:MAG: metallophosphoesterase [Candidatus Schekmanbacteria bacterium]|nr:metallophosphoesterase [Candidatus Schekmanbacteria bacterium]